MQQYDPPTKPCDKGPQPGTIALRDFVIPLDSAFSYLGIYNCRNVGGTSRPSVHGNGRGLDVGCLAANEDGLKAGNMLADWVTEHHDVLNVQMVIWNGRRWGGSTLNSDYPNLSWSEYTGLNDHKTHLHIEQNKLGAAMSAEEYGRAITAATEEEDDEMGYVDSFFNDNNVWIVQGDGAVFTVKGEYLGGANDLTLNKPIVCGVATSCSGYYLVAKDGGVFAYGDASYHGRPKLDEGELVVGARLTDSKLVFATTKWRELPAVK